MSSWLARLKFGSGCDLGKIALQQDCSKKNEFHFNFSKVGSLKLST